MKKLFTMLIAIAMVMTLAACGDIEHYNEVDNLEVVEEQETQETREIEIDGSKVYVMKFKLKQSHFSLDLGKHIKDAMNAIEISFPVDVEYYDTYDIGDEVIEDFRMGSFLMEGSIGKWQITVVDEQIVDRT